MFNRCHRCIRHNPYVGTARRAGRARRRRRGEAVRFCTVESNTTSDRVENPAPASSAQATPLRLSRPHPIEPMPSIAQKETFACRHNVDPIRIFRGVRTAHAADRSRCLGHQDRYVGGVLTRMMHDRQTAGDVQGPRRRQAPRSLYKWRASAPNESSGEVAPRRCRASGRNQHRVDAPDVHDRAFLPAVPVPGCGYGCIGEPACWHTMWTRYRATTSARRGSSRVRVIPCG